ncbi:hypothetical protein TSYNT_623 [Tepidanaerobacter syntrophicus]|uniref:Uncharacterized protein n=1 Tax=Tepidanaerobacter syntrophicus TaxID=224999 RepID=A0A0U9HFI2_9FIRM|nr:hypothetical protein TSYNT_623 [Tepidanaerobacter syntrophicus]
MGHKKLILGRLVILGLMILLPKPYINGVKYNFCKIKVKDKIQSLAFYFCCRCKIKG